MESKWSPNSVVIRIAAPCLLAPVAPLTLAQISLTKQDHRGERGGVGLRGIGSAS